LGLNTSRTCFPFHPPADLASGHLERVRQFYTVPRRNKKDSAAGFQKLPAKTGLRSPADCATRQAVRGAKIPLYINEIGRLAHHGKSIENCLLLLDLSRFLKL
jgi:hypothetical protein